MKNNVHPLRKRLILFWLFSILFCLSGFNKVEAQRILPPLFHKPAKVKEAKVKEDKVYRLRDLKKIKIGMTIRQVERKLGQKFRPEPEKVGLAQIPLSKDFKIVGIKGQNMQNIGLRFYKRRLYAIFVVYQQNQWADNKSLLRFVSKELKIKPRWKTLLQSGTLDMKEMNFPKFLIGVTATGVDYTVYIVNKKNMDRFKKQVKAKLPTP